MKQMILKRMALRKEQGKKGFTLIEVIVVLVILAILAAIAIPALTGYIDKANQRAAISEAANIRTSLQAISSDSYTTGGTPLTGIVFDGATKLHNTTGTNSDTDLYGYNPISDASGTATIGTEVSRLTGVSVPNANLTDIKYDAQRVLIYYKYTTSSGKTVTFDGGNYAIA
jgi:prepilin-type N-terminal cleavage/methylation domain-containing protein